MKRRICFSCREFWLTGVDECPQCGKPGEVIEDETLEMVREIWSDVSGVSDDEPPSEDSLDALQVVVNEGLTLSDMLDQSPMFLTDVAWEPNRWIERVDVFEDGTIERRVLDIAQGVSSFFKREAVAFPEWKVSHKLDMDADHLERLGDLWLFQMDMRATSLTMEGQYGCC